MFYLPMKNKWKQIYYLFYFLYFWVKNYNSNNFAELKYLK